MTLRFWRNGKEVKLDPEQEQAMSDEMDAAFIRFGEGFAAIERAFAAAPRSAASRPARGWLERIRNWRPGR